MAAPEQHQVHKDAPWYAGGLRFGCQRCGRCCTGPPGYVWLQKTEIQQIARSLKMPTREFERQFCRHVFLRVSLLERPNGDCIFFTAAGCSIYAVRPVQCKSFPFWKSLKNPADWEALKARCPGVGKGRLYSLEEIEAISDGKRAVSEHAPRKRPVTQRQLQNGQPSQPKPA